MRGALCAHYMHYIHIYKCDVFVVGVGFCFAYLGHIGLISYHGGHGLKPGGHMELPTQIGSGGQQVESPTAIGHSTLHRGGQT